MLKSYVDEALLKWPDLLKRPGAVAVLEGKINGKWVRIINYSSKGIHPDTLSNMLHPLVKKWLNNPAKFNVTIETEARMVSSNGKWIGTHGKCAEPFNISEWLFAVEKELGLEKGALKLDEAIKSLEGTSSSARSIVNGAVDKLVHGLDKKACRTCNPLLKHFGITEIF